MMVHFLLSGYLFVWVLIGIDPGPKRWSPAAAPRRPVRDDGVPRVLRRDHDRRHDPARAGLLRPARPAPGCRTRSADQQRAGAIAWGVGEAPTLALALMVAQHGSAPTGPRRKRRDRQADRDGDAELAAYNAQLAQRRAAHEQAERVRDERAASRARGRHQRRGRLTCGSRWCRSGTATTSRWPSGSSESPPWCAQQAGHDLVVLPELWAPGGFAYRDWDERAEPVDGPIGAGDVSRRPRRRGDAARRVDRRAARRRRDRPGGTRAVEHLARLRPPTASSSPRTARSTGSASARASRS